jgi:hypothetical protein
MCIPNILMRPPGMKSCSRMFFLFGLLFLASGFATAKDRGRITGSITDIAGYPLHNVIIRIIQEVEDGELFSIIRSDNNGIFKTTVLNPGIYHIQVSHQGYQPITTAKFAIDENRSISLDFALQEFAGYISRDEDPRNWDFKNVLRSTSDRRLIFRDAPRDIQSSERKSQTPFVRSGFMSVASDTSQGSESYLMRPQASQSGVSSNFALTEPLNSTSRIILSGQVDVGAGSFWRIRNTYNYRPDNDHDYRASVGYGRMTGNYPNAKSFLPSSNLLPVESGIETFAFSMEGSTKFLNMLAVKYGIDYSRLHYGADKSFFCPSIQILMTPIDGWSFQTSIVSRRISDRNSIVLPGGEIVNLSEPTMITMVGNNVSMSQMRHSEMAAQRNFTSGTAIELAIYQDYIHGPGLPLIVTSITPVSRQSHVMEMNEKHSSQKGMRATVKHRFFDILNGSVAYIYGESKGISKNSGLLSSALRETNPGNFLQQQYQHSITGRFEAMLPLSKTNIVATIRWNSGNPLTALDWFSDRMDIGTKSANFEMRQTLPMPEFLGSVGRWEFMLDVRNALNQGRETLTATDGALVLNRNPRSLRFGLNYSFR